ncbi:pyruvate formate-lyase-activating protein [Thermobrachium celere]|uniref:Pyruvate formate-lyase-activating enzyme n=2 Tax=Thermobrachium celere DSM 8682 TaxID=941824 RepID=R7RSV2_9CLOT|nr:pyruvate formate-lyase-activating protein [Thermobrachium celere]GFR34549.1 pyruvate formate-lyase-activating enzyme [Thermobrachium celere]CDF58456.1 Pyruvate formate-lyase activating enzyme [Thermobrachium celere DSM 8682]
MVTARVHSIETMGLVDGPGIRVVVFMQGCKLRCAYCHNPDTWDQKGGFEISVEELIQKVKRYKIYFNHSGGGVTLSGGDPLLQPEFVIEFFKRCKEEGIHTTLDTSGYGIGMYDEILKYTDLVLLDIKHIDDIEHKKLTGYDRHGFFEFLDALKRNNTKMWIRHVVVPGITDGEEHIRALAQFIKTIPNVEKVELLPYHVHGVNKYQELGIKYRLEGVEPLSKERLEYLKNILSAELKDVLVK